MKKVLKIVGNVLLWSMFALAAFITVISLATSGPDRVPSVGGYIPFSIQTESMEPTINAGDLIITREYNHGEELEEGTVISFFAIEQDVKIIKTHRIVEYNEEMDSYVTKGDNNELQDELEVPLGDIISVWEGTRIPFLGKIKDVFGSKYGFLVLIILPLFLFFLYQLYSFIVLIIEVRKEQLIKEVKAEVSNDGGEAPETETENIAELEAKLKALKQANKETVKPDKTSEETAETFENDKK